METTGKKCCFTGHRPEKMPFRANDNSYAYKQFTRALERAIQEAINDGYRYFITGMARGMDLWAAQIVLNFRRAYPDIQLEAAIPFEGQHLTWNYRDQEIYNKVRSRCNHVTVLSKAEPARDQRTRVMHNRNRYMVDNSTMLIAAYDGTPGGTRYTIDYAKQHGLDVVNIFDKEYFEYSIL